VNLPPPVRSAIDAANAGDTDAFLAAFTPDGVVDGERVSRMTIRA
jgi:hypothetical protein